MIVSISNAGPTAWHEAHRLCAAIQPKHVLPERNLASLSEGVGTCYLDCHVQPSECPDYTSVDEMELASRQETDHACQRHSDHAGIECRAGPLHSKTSLISMPELQASQRFTSSTSTTPNAKPSSTKRSQPPRTEGTEPVMKRELQKFAVRIGRRDKLCAPSTWTMDPNPDNVGKDMPLTSVGVTGSNPVPPTGFMIESV